jgi:Histidine kinase-, DNA gyrase B-, and HSP90-like ATPase
MLDQPHSRQRGSPLGPRHSHLPSLEAHSSLLIKIVIIRPDTFRQSWILGGLGLGLSISRTLVELHSGEIRAKSAGPGQGSVFRIKLPLVGWPEWKSRSTNIRDRAAGQLWRILAELPSV